MTRRVVHLLAVPLIVGALVLALLRPEQAEAGPSTSYGAIAQQALAAVDQYRGECFPWVRSVVQAAIGRTIGSDYHGGYLQAGAAEVPLLNAHDGDVIQIANPGITSGSVNYPGLHTAIVLDNYGDGSFRVIDANRDFDGVVHIRDQYTPSEMVARYPGLVVRVYRFDRNGSVAVTAPAASSSAPSQPVPARSELPAPGSAVTIAADGDCLRIRSAAGLNGVVVGCLPSGARVTVTQQGPTADGYQWVQVAAGALEGWVAANYLSESAYSTVMAPSAVVAPAPGFAASPRWGVATGQASAVFMGGSVDDLFAAAGAAQATGAWVQAAGGEFTLLIVGGPDFMLDAFRARFPGAFGGPVAVTLIGASN